MESTTEVNTIVENEAFIPRATDGEMAVAPAEETEVNNRQDTGGLIPTTTNNQTVVTIEDIQDYLRRNKEIVENEGPYSSKSRTFITNAMPLLERFASNIEMILKSEEVTRFMHNVARLSARYEDDPKFLQNLNRWYDCRKKLIDVTNWAADELDNLQLITNVARCTGSFVELLRSFNLGVFQQIRSSLTEYASGISIPFGALTECVFELFSHFGYMGFGSSFLATIRSQMIINEVIIAMRKDKKMFKPLKEWFRETKEFDDFVKKLFPYGISLESLLAIDDALKYNQEEAKIFAAMFFSNVGRNPSLFTNLNFITEAYLFCKSGAGKEWYKRMINIGNPADQESAYLYLRNELLALEENRSSDSDAVVEIGKLQIKSSTLGRYALIGLNGFHVYQCSSMLLSGSKHKFSSRLRELSENAQSFRKSMKKFEIDFHNFS